MKTTEKITIFIVIVLIIICYFMMRKKRLEYINFDIDTPNNQDKKFVIVPNLVGGLGNQMFIIAAAYSLARRTNRILLLIEQKKIQSYGGIRPSYYNTIFNKINTIKKLYTTFFNIITGYNFYNNVDGNIKLIVKNKDPFISYFQDIKYFDKYRNDIRNLFKPNIILNTIVNMCFNKLKLNITKDNIVAVHIRFVDNLTHNNYYGITTTSEINSIRDLIDKLKKNNYKILIFSNNIKKSKELFDNNYYSNFDDYIELYMLSKCNYVISSPSTFCWWGLYLNKHLKNIWILWDRYDYGRHINDIYNIFPQNKIVL